MRRPVEHEIRQDEMRTAAMVRAESESGFEKKADPMTLAHDCAVLLETWFRGISHGDPPRAMVLRAEVETLMRRMRELGDGVTLAMTQPFLDEMFKQKRAQRRPTRSAKSIASRRACSWHSQGIRSFTPEDYDALLSAQGGGCAICRSKNSKTKNGTLCVDHDHETGAVRGLLCHTCNVALGLFQEQGDRLLSAADYIGRNQQAGRKL